MAKQASRTQGIDQEVLIGAMRLPGHLVIPEYAKGIVIFAHGSGSSRFSQRNRTVAATLNNEQFGSLLFDLLTADEESDRENVFDIAMLADRLNDAKWWLANFPSAENQPLGFFGASTGAGAALLAAAQSPEKISAIVSRGGRPDLAGDALWSVLAPTLLLVGGADDYVIELNKKALAQMRCVSSLKIIPGATHLFPEPGALESVSLHATAWFQAHLTPRN